MAVVTGVVEAYSTKFDKHSILVDGVWWRSNFQINCEKGDTVTFENGDKKYCNKLKVLEKGDGSVATSAGTAPSGGASAPYVPKVGFPTPTNTKERSIVRQNSLAHATDLVVAWIRSDGTTPVLMEATDTIVEIARVFEAYSSGDADYAEAVKGLGDE